MVRYPEKKKKTFSHATNGFPAKWQLGNERRNSIMMTPSYPDLGSASDWLKEVPHALRPIRSTIQIWVVTRHQYGISALVSQTSFRGETVGGVAKCRLFSQTNGSITGQTSRIFFENIVPTYSLTNQFKFCLKIPFYFHLSVKSAMSTSIFLSTARKKPVEKAIFLRFHVGIKWRNLIGSFALDIGKP